MKKQIDATREITGVSEFGIEKDFYVTQAISILNEITHDHLALILQGGTSLSKAYHITERMSEDCDFRIRFKSSLSRSQQEKKCREFRHKIIHALGENNFIISDKNVLIRNEGQYMKVEAKYPSIYPPQKESIIKPFLVLEFFVATVQESTEEKSVTTLIKEHLLEQVNHNVTQIKCVAAIETAAEKWVRLTRRIATADTSHKHAYDDQNIVRHLYDLYKIDESGSFTDNFYTLIGPIILSDRARYKKDNPEYYNNPIREIQRAVKTLNTAPEWQKNYNQFLDEMVFTQGHLPTYDDVMKYLNQKTKQALLALEADDFFAAV